MERVLQNAHADFQTLEDIDHLILLRRNIADLELDKFRRLAEPAQFLKDFVKFFSRCQDELVTPDDYQRYVNELRKRVMAKLPSMEEDARAVAMEEVGRQEEVARAYRVSEKLLRERKLLTFGAQLMQAVQLLRSDTALLEQMRAQYRHILVDEFQDTNVAQLELLWLLGRRPAKYRGRGRRRSGDLPVSRRFSVRELHDSLSSDFAEYKAPIAQSAKKFLVPLSRNYRSTQRILRGGRRSGLRSTSASALLPEKELVTEKTEGDKIRIAEFRAAGVWKKKPTG